MLKPFWIASGVILMFLSTGMMAGAYHIPQDGYEENVADDWEAGNGQMGAFCESLGNTDKVNANPIASAGKGGLCYASSRSFTTGCIDLSPAPLLVQDWDCTFDKDAGKDMKPNQTTNSVDWGKIKPICLDADPTLNPTGCEPRMVGGIGANWFIRIGSNARSCQGNWNQTFVYKEAIAYYGGAAPNTDGISGHVTFFVNDFFTEGTYSYRRLQTVNPSAAGIDLAKSVNGTPNVADDDACTGNGSQWGLQAFEEGFEPDCRAHYRLEVKPGAKPVTYSCDDDGDCDTIGVGAIWTVTCIRADTCDEDDLVTAGARLLAAALAGSSVKADVLCDDVSVFAGLPSPQNPPTASGMTVKGTRNVVKATVLKDNFGEWKCVMTFTPAVGDAKYEAKAWCSDPRTP
jgi:hypothetical protein